MPRLNLEQRAFVVQRLACFRTPSEVVEDFRDRYEVEISRQQVAAYDPTTGEQPAKKWVELFYVTRREYVEDLARHGIAHMAFRIDIMDRVLRRALSMRNDDMALRTLEQAAKERGGAFTNRRTIAGPDGGAVQFVVVDPGECATEKEWEEEVQRAIAARGHEVPPPTSEEIKRRQSRQTK